ncbi:MAG TPA: NAD-glutamate dehydrogenase [Steroidobacteraceae bacterium]|nr:NAD-glutamate dehydrogenase [Steroidobacteraceae bacterium]
MLGKIPAARLALIEKIVGHALKSVPRKQQPLAREFLGAYFRGVAEEDLRAHSPADLAAAALAHLEFGRRRTGTTVCVDIAPPLNVDAPTASHRALLRVVTPDMPFLVDSIGIVFSQMNIAVHLIVHPVLAVRRDARGALKTVGIDRREATLESWQMMEIDRPRDATAALELEQRVRAALEDVRRAVVDFRAMLERIRAVANDLERAALPVPKSHASEARALLAWMHDGHFVFLGYRHYRLKRGRSRDALVRDTASGLGILREPASRKGSSKASPPILLTGHLRQQARTPDLLVLTKANTASTVHRGSYLDYVGIKTFDASGQVSGEHRFLGLWTSSAYHKPPAEIPLLRRKLEAVIAHFGLPAQSHDAKSVVNVIETFPRDELFQTPTSELIASVRGIVNLYERRRVRLFARRDSFERFYSCLVYVPRDRYNTEVRARIERIVCQRFGGTHVETQVQISDSMLARLHMLVRTPQGAPAVESVAAVEVEIAAATATWEDRLQQALIERGVERGAVELAMRYARAFPPAYRADVEPAQALEDIADLVALAANPAVPQLNLRARATEKQGHLSLRILRANEPISISDILPMLENFGLRVLAEHPYQMVTPERTVWIQDFELEARDPKRADVAALEPLFKEAFLAAWRGDIENDGFNRLLLCASLSARDIVVVRAYCRYLLQTGIPFSQAYMERVLVAQAPIAGALVRLFQTQFALTNRARESAAERIAKGILRALDKVASLDEDRILRSYLTVIRATLRTNYYQTMDGVPKSWVSFKLDPHAIPDLPLPRPKFEIFVYSPRVEGVHMRMGYVARGGLRWSDRREDFRTEVLGLMKAQHVKNTVIVPVGAKGGFYPKRLPVGGSRDDVQKEVIASYQTFIRGLLDVTDNIVNGKVAVRPGIVRRDGDDAYLVVAADKGTATFSDIANAISIEYGHWLGDAFASGGSAGYDHKGMGITARGAWECVKRHFRELGVDIQAQEFTCAGVGDMSGDVFGNGMLLSRHTRLVAAFDHRHIFLDPNAPAAAGFRERERLFKLPRSSWDDYSRKLISRGGGVWPRGAKAIPLSAEAQKLLDLDVPSATPVEVMRAILRLRVDLLWNGGIGTYVKATDESHAEVRDRANDAIRADGREIRARVIGEGGNLGCTQRGRVEYARSGGSEKAGGRLNTDFIDNSAGVNTSDLEVNIKILLSEMERRGRLPRAARNKLLASMTDEVASLVLRNNYLQTQALSVLEQRAPERLIEYQNLIRALERSGNLDRDIEFLPGDEEFLERRKKRLGLTRPELAVVLAYSKIWLSNHLIDSDLPDDPYFASEVQRYFPAPMRKRYSRQIPRHRLRREIVATATTNSLVNRMGPVFVARAQEDTDADPATIARAYTIAREIFSMRSVWAEIESLDNAVPADVQYGMFFRTSRLLRHTSYWLLRERDQNLSIEDVVRELRAGVEQLIDSIDSVIAGDARAQHDATLAGLAAGGVPEKLARRVTRLSLLEPALDIVALARAENIPVADVARVYFELGVLLGFDWLHAEIDRLVVDGSWQATARTTLRDSAMRAHRDLANQVLNTRGPARVSERVARWSAQRAEALASWTRTLAEMRAVGSTDFATLTVGVEAVRGLSSG